MPDELLERVRANSFCHSFNHGYCVCSAVEDPHIPKPYCAVKIAAFVWERERLAKIEVLETCAKERCAACRNGLPVLCLDTPYPTHKNASGEVFDCRAQLEQRMIAELRKEAGE